MTTAIARLAAALAVRLATEVTADGDAHIVEGSVRKDGRDNPVRLRLSNVGDKVVVASAPLSLKHRELVDFKPGQMNTSLEADESQRTINSKVEMFCKRYLDDAIRDSALAAEFANGNDTFNAKTAATVAALGGAVALNDIDGIHVGKSHVGGSDQEVAVKVAGDIVSIAGVRMTADRAVKVLAALRD